MAEIVRKIGKITRYETKSYVGRARSSTSIAERGPASTPPQTRDRPSRASARPAVEWSDGPRAPRSERPSVRTSAAQRAELTEGASGSRPWPSRSQSESRVSSERRDGLGRRSAVTRSGARRLLDVGPPGSIACPRRVPDAARRRGDRAVVESSFDALGASCPDSCRRRVLRPGAGARSAARARILASSASSSTCPREVRGAPSGSIRRASSRARPTSTSLAWRARRLHASTSPPTTTQLDVDGSPDVHLVRRAALAIGRGLALARAPAEATADASERRALELAHDAGRQAGDVRADRRRRRARAQQPADVDRRLLGLPHPQGRRDASGHDPDDVERLRRISESANRMLRFTRDLVALRAPVERGAASGRRSTASSTRRSPSASTCSPERGADVERRFGADVLAVRGVSEQLVQVFVNLLTNASQALPAAGGRARS